MEVKISKLKTFKAGAKSTSGDFSYTVSFENGDSGWVRSKKELPHSPGDELAYTIETKTKKDGSGTYNIINLMPKENHRTRPVLPSKFKDEAKLTAAMKAFDKTIDLLIENKIAWERIAQTFRDLAELLYTEIDAYICNGTDEA